MVHYTETCDRKKISLITHVHTTPATVHEAQCTALIQEALSERQLPPREHIVDAAYMGAELLVTSAQERHITLVGPPRPKAGWQNKVAGAYGYDQFTVDWERQQVQCPQGKWSRPWRERRDPSRDTSRNCGPVLGRTNLCEENAAAETRNGVGRTLAAARWRKTAIVQAPPGLVSKADQKQSGRHLGRVAGEICARQAGVAQCGDGLSRIAGVTVTAEKKSVTAAERNNRKRAWFWRKLRTVAHDRLKFIDESGVTTVLTRLFGRAVPGERIGEAVPKNYGQSTSVVSVLGIDGVETTMVIEGAVDTLVFDAFCDNFLRPCLEVGDVVVLDNLGVHRASRIEETIRGLPRIFAPRIVLRVRRAACVPARLTKHGSSNSYHGNSTKRCNRHVQFTPPRPGRNAMHGVQASKEPSHKVSVPLAHAARAIAGYPRRICNR